MLFSHSTQRRPYFWTTSRSKINNNPCPFLTIPRKSRSNGKSTSGDPEMAHFRCVSRGSCSLYALLRYVPKRTQKTHSVTISFCSHFLRTTQGKRTKTRRQKYIQLLSLTSHGNIYNTRKKGTHYYTPRPWENEKNRKIFEKSSKK